MFHYSLRVIDEPKMSDIRILNLCHKKSILVDIYRQSLLKFFLVLQYHQDKAFHFPGKFLFLVKTITDSDRLGLVYLNLVFCEIYVQSVARITTDPRFIYYLGGAPNRVMQTCLFYHKCAIMGSYEIFHFFNCGYR